MGKNDEASRAMLKPFLTALTLTAALSGCATIRNSAVNPFNWFGRGQEAPVEASTEAVNPLIPAQRRGLIARSRERQAAAKATSPIDQVTSLQIERIPGGAIIRAAGVDSRLGTFDAVLVPSNDDELPEDGVLTYTLERRLPKVSPTGGPASPRPVIVARRVTDNTLRGVRTIRVAGSQNALVARR